MFIKLLTEEDKQLINILRVVETDDSDYYVEDSLNEFVSCNCFLHFWNFNKTFLSHIFKDKLIIKKPVNVKIEDNALLNEVKQLRWSAIFDNFVKTIYKMLRINNDIYKKIDHGQSYTNIWETLQYWVFNEEALLSNKYEGDTIELVLPDFKVFKITYGTKIMKILRRLSKAANVEDVFEQIRIAQSQILNEAYISATLCLSIHPLDYLTASLNNNDWTSCMNWEEGDYRRGVIEMMNSSYVVVAYLESSSQQLTFRHNNKTYTWNSKKWREFFIVSPEGIFGIKGYPFWSRQLEDISLNWIKDLLVQDGENQYADSIITWTTDDKYLPKEERPQVIMQFFCGPAMYNDFYGGNTYHAILAKGLEGTIKINYSGESECVVCGEEDEESFEGDEKRLICTNCIPQTRCSQCGAMVYTPTAYRHNNDIYCFECWNEFPECDCCGELITFLGFNFYVGTGGSNPILASQCSHWVCLDCMNFVFKDGESEMRKHHFKHDQLPVVPAERIRNLESLLSKNSIRSFLAKKSTRSTLKKNNDSKIKKIDFYKKIIYNMYVR